jgi:hypothetical protein
VEIYPERFRPKRSLEESIPGLDVASRSSSLFGLVVEVVGNAIVIPRVLVFLGIVVNLGPFVNVMNFLANTPLSRRLEL